MAYLAIAYIFIWFLIGVLGLIIFNRLKQNQLLLNQLQAKVKDITKSE